MIIMQIYLYVAVNTSVYNKINRFNQRYYIATLQTREVIIQNMHLLLQEKHLDQIAYSKLLPLE